MAIATQGTAGNYLQRGPSPSGLADVLTVILDKGLVIDVYLRVSLVGIELLTVDARIVVASVDTYLRFAEAVGRLNLTESDNSQGLPELVEGMTENGARSKTKGAIEGVKEKLGFDDEDDDDSRAKSRTRKRPARARRDDDDE